jgi:hypothetical protein
LTVLQLNAKKVPFAGHRTFNFRVRNRPIGFRDLAALSSIYNAGDRVMD